MINGRTMRVDKEFDELVGQLRAERLLRNIDNKILSERRITKAIARKIKRDINLKEIFVSSPLDEDRIR